MPQNDGPTALRHLEKAIELKPSYAQAHHWVAYLKLVIGHPERALEHASRAVRLNRRVPAAHALLAEAYLANGQSEEALAAARRAKSLEPEYGTAYTIEGMILYHMDRPADALAVLRRAYSLLPERAVAQVAATRALSALAYAVSGDTTRAVKRATRLKKDSVSFWRGLAHAGLGATDAAWDAFGDVEDWEEWSTFHLRYYYPDVLAPLRKDPRYRELIREVNQQWGLNPDGSIPDSVDVSFDTQDDE